MLPKLIKELPSDQNSESEGSGGSEDGESEVSEGRDGEENMESEGDESEGNEQENIESEGDAEIKESMADVMYICCQRPEKRQVMLQNADRKLVKCICQCAKNVLKGEIPINYTEKDNLEKHKKVLRRLSDPEISTEDKKEIIVQNGGNFLLSLIPTVVGALASMFQG